MCVRMGCRRDGGARSEEKCEFIGGGVQEFSLLHCETGRNPIELLVWRKFPDCITLIDLFGHNPFQIKIVFLKINHISIK